MGFLGNNYKKMNLCLTTLNYREKKLNTQYARVIVYGLGDSLSMGVHRGGQEGALDPPGRPKWYVF